jgi:hypothetical protein
VQPCQGRPPSRRSPACSSAVASPRSPPPRRSRLRRPAPRREPAARGPGPGTASRPGTAAQRNPVRAVVDQHALGELEDHPARRNVTTQVQERRTGHGGRVGVDRQVHVGGHAPEPNRTERPSAAPIAGRSSSTPSTTASANGSAGSRCGLLTAGATAGVHASWIYLLLSTVIGLTPTPFGAVMRGLWHHSHPSRQRAVGRTAWTAWWRRCCGPSARCWSPRPDPPPARPAPTSLSTPQVQARPSSPARSPPGGPQPWSSLSAVDWKPVTGINVRRCRGYPAGNHGRSQRRSRPRQRYLRVLAEHGDPRSGRTRAAANVVHRYPPLRQCGVLMNSFHRRCASASDSCATSTGGRFTTLTRDWASQLGRSDARLTSGLSLSGPLAGSALLG